VSEETIKQTIEEFIEAGWTDTPIAWENIEPRSPADASLLYEGTVPYIYVQVQVSEVVAISVPLNCKRYFGEVLVDIHIPEGTGSRQAAIYTDTLNALLQYKVLDYNIRLKQFIRVGGPYQLREGWSVYSSQWPLEAEFQ